MSIVCENMASLTAGVSSQAGAMELQKKMAVLEEVRAGGARTALSLLPAAKP